MTHQQITTPHGATYRLLSQTTQRSRLNHTQQRAALNRYEHNPAISHTRMHASHDTPAVHHDGMTMRCTSDSNRTSMVPFNAHTCHGHT